MAKVTITRLAQELGLSVCTINKALTNKPRISPDTKARVLEAATRFGYRPNRLAQALARPVLSVGLVYPETWPSHFGLLIRGACQRLGELQDHRVQAELRPMPAASRGAEFLRTIKELAARRMAGVLICLGRYQERHLAAAWQCLAAAQIPFVFLGADMPTAPRLTAVWHDCRRCGRVAAELLALLAGDRPAAILIGTERGVPDHELKIAGFRDQARESRLHFAGVYETLDEPAEAYPAARKLFAEHPDVAGIYIGSENAAGICRYLVDHGLAGRTRVVATGISADVLQGLQVGVVQASLCQCQHRQGRLAVEALYGYLQDGKVPAPEILVPPEVVLRNTIDQWTQLKTALGELPTPPDGWPAPS